MKRRNYRNAKKNFIQSKKNNQKKKNDEVSISEDKETGLLILRSKDSYEGAFFISKEAFSNLNND